LWREMIGGGRGLGGLMSGMRRFMGGEEELLRAWRQSEVGTMLSRRV
jgi:hypothetical protein